MPAFLRDMVSDRASLGNRPHLRRGPQHPSTGNDTTEALLKRKPTPTPNCRIERWKKDGTGPEVTMHIASGERNMEAPEPASEEHCVFAQGQRDEQSDDQSRPRY
ncbi:hypothetical protein VUR80DRAFT_2289 [Thermomyces stellatus]